MSDTQPPNPIEEKQSSPIEPPKHFRDVLLEYLQERDVDFLIKKLMDNQYGIFYTPKLNAEVNALRYAVLNEIMEKFVLIKRQDWEVLKPVIDAYEQQQRANSEASNSVSG